MKQTRPGAVDHAVRALARIGADDADRERVGAGDAVLAVERGCHRNLQRLGKRDEFRRGAGGANAAPGDDDRPLGFLEAGERGKRAGAVGLRPERRHLLELWLDQRLKLGLLSVDLTLVAAKLQMHRAGRARDRDPKRLPHHVGEAAQVVHRGIELGHRLERWDIVDFLVDLAEFCPRLAPAGHGDHRRMGEPRVAQPRREVERADHLRHADARFAARPRIAVGHIGGRLLPVHVEPLDPGAALHHGESFAQHRRHMEDMRHAVAFEHVSEALSARHSAIVAKHGGLVCCRRESVQAD